MTPQPTPSPRHGQIRIPAPNAASVAMRYAPLSQRDRFNPMTWANTGSSYGDVYVRALFAFVSWR
jgi:hypothetical protein